MCLISINHNRECNEEILISVPYIPSHNNAAEREFSRRLLFVILVTTSVRQFWKESNVNTSHGNFLENIHWGILKKFTVKTLTLRYHYFETLKNVLCVSHINHLFTNPNDTSVFSNR